jgi:small-conductance mechanosensitive channel
MISAAVLIIIVISILLGIKDFIPNFLAGLQIYRKEMVGEGDFIRVRGTEGEVTSLDITEITLKTAKGDMIYIPNSILIKEDFTKLRRKRKK